MMTLYFVSPMALTTPSSLVCSKRLALIEELKEKKQRNIVMTMMTLKTTVMIVSTCSKVAKSSVPSHMSSWELYPALKESFRSAVRFPISYLSFPSFIMMKRRS